MLPPGRSSCPITTRLISMCEVADHLSESGRVIFVRPAKSSTQPRKAKTWCALKFKWAPVLAFLSGYFMQPTRRSCSKSFNAQVIQECAQRGTSIASVALNHGLNANLVHKWIRMQAQQSTALQPAFIPLPVPLVGASLHSASSNICVESSIQMAPSK